MNHADAEMIASDLVRALRGRRSRPDFSRRLGFRSNVVHRWETAAAWPAMDDFVRALVRIWPDVGSLFERFMGRRPESEPVGGSGPTKAEVAAFLREQRGKTPIRVLAERTGYNRYQIARWQKGQTRPRLPEFLCLLEASSRRTLDLVACLVDPMKMPTVAPRWRSLLAARQAAYDAPWSHAILRAIEVEGHLEPPGLTLLADRTGMDEDLIKDGLERLIQSGQVRKVRGRYRVENIQMVDTRDPARGRALKAYWGRMALGRLEHDTASGTFGYSLFAVSRADLERLQALQMEYVRAMQSVVADSKDPDCVGLYCSQLLDLRARG